VEGEGSRDTELMEGKMAGTSEPNTVSTKLQRIAELARKAPDMVLLTLAHHIDVDFLREAYRLTRKDGAAGVDGQTAAEYAANLEDNLRSLHERFKSGCYRAPPVRRVHIPKGDGRSRRPIGIPAFEDKVLQRAVVMVLEAVYEQDFLSCSYGFRPGCSAHQALEALREALMSMYGGWVVEVDIQRFFDTLDHKHLRDFLDLRVRDGVLRRAIGKWLHAGVMADGRLEFPEAGTPQGGVVSPLLANVYLHEVLDKWFVATVRPRLRGRAELVRYADDFVVVCEREEDARVVMAVLPKRFGKYGLTIHPEKTRVVRFERPSKGARGSQGPRGPAGPTSRTFDFLGFTHYWGRSLRGAWVVKKRTAKSRLSRALRRINEWCRDHRHLPLAEQQEQLGRKLSGHYGYFGVTGNFECLESFFRETLQRWRHWLSRRSQRGYVSWDHFKRLLGRYTLPKPRIVHSYLNAANP
jgi:group II intron reverse transcriptase/maturase